MILTRAFDDLAVWEGGIRGTWPLEVKAGMDAVELRKQYGRT